MNWNNMMQELKDEILFSHTKSLNMYSCIHTVHCCFFYFKFSFETIILNH